MIYITYVYALSGGLDVLSFVFGNRSISPGRYRCCPLGSGGARWSGSVRAHDRIHAVGVSTPWIHSWFRFHNNPSSFSVGLLTFAVVS